MQWQVGVVPLLQPLYLRIQVEFIHLQLWLSKEAVWGGGGSLQGGETGRLGPKHLHLPTKDSQGESG